MKVACYARVSSERQVEKDLSIPAQLKALRKYALEHGWEVVAEYIDEAESARTANRPKFKEMVAAARRKSKPFEAILVWKLSRFARNREDSIIYKSLLRKHGVQVVSINEPVDDSAAGKLLEGMIEVLDEFYSTNLSEDTLRGMKENAERGFCNGGGIPFGYKADKLSVGSTVRSRLQPDESEAPIIRRIFQMALGGEGSKNIAEALDREELRTRAGKLFSKTTVNYMLRNEVYTGNLAWTCRNREVIRTSGAHLPLVSKEDFSRVQQLLTDRRPKVRHPRTVTSQYLLSPLLHCANCGAPMIGASAKSGTYHYYRCNSSFKMGKYVCSAPMVSRAKIEGFVIERLKGKVLTDENLTDLVRMVNEEIHLLVGRGQERLEETEKRLESVNERLLRHYTALETGKLDFDDLAPRIKDLREEQNKLQKARDEVLAGLEDSKPRELNKEEVIRYVQDFKVLLSKGKLVEQKAFLRSFIKRIDFDPTRVAIEYTVPMPAEKDRTSEREVLSIEQIGSAGRTRTYDQAVNSRPLYR